MKTATNHTEYITNEVQVDRFVRVRLASLEYNPDSNRPDDCGELYVAPVTRLAGHESSGGELCLFATTNGDPILLGFIRDGELEFTPATERESGLDESMIDALKRAVWHHPANSDNSYSYLVADAVNDL